MKIEQEELLRLIERSRQGDQEAQATLVQAVQNRVYYHCKKMLKNETDAEDAAQDVLITMLTSLDKLKEPAAFWGWVNGITANRCRHLLSAPHKEWQIPEDEEGGSMLDDMENLDETWVPDKALDNEETRRMILGLVDELPPEQRMCVLFYYYDEMSVKEIAAAMDTSEGTVKSRLNYARRSIKSGVEDYERSGIKLYSASPILLLIYFLRQEAATFGLDGAAAAAMAGQVLSHAGTAAGGGAAAAGTAGTAAAEGGAAGAAAGTVPAAAPSVAAAEGAAASAAAGAGAAAAGAGTAAAAGVSAKVIAAVLAGAIAIGGAAVGLTSRSNQDNTQPHGEITLPFTEEPSGPSDPTAFGAIHGFSIVSPETYEGLPVTVVLGNPDLSVLPSSSRITPPFVTVSEPDEEGYVTYTVTYTVSAEVHIGTTGSTILSYSIIAQDYNLYDYYTGRLYFPDERMDTEHLARAVGSAEVERNGESFVISYEKSWTSGGTTPHEGWTASSQPGVSQEVQINPFQDVTYTVRVPADYDGLLIGVNITDPGDPEQTITEEWDLETEDPSHYRFISLKEESTSLRTQQAPTPAT